MKGIMLIFPKQAAVFMLHLLPLFLIPVKTGTGKPAMTSAAQLAKPVAPVNIPALPNNYNIGTGIAKVTDPAIGLGMQGMSETGQKTSGVESHLYSRAFIIEHVVSKKRVILLNADIWSCTHAIKKEVVRQLQLAYGNLYTMDNVLLSGTHNHSGPGGFSHYFLYNYSIGGFDPYNFECIVSGMVLSIKKAHTALAPGRIYVNKGDVPDCGRNRSMAAYNNNPVGERSKYSHTTDKEMLLLKFVKLNGSTETPVGVLNWYGIHPTSRGQKNTRVCGDNKGYASYLFETMMRGKSGKDPFVAAFANASAGDVSGNVEFGKIPDGVKDRQHMEVHGRRQFDKALELYLGATEELKGDLDFRHRFVDMVDITKTPGTLGLSMFAGSTEDSDPGSGLKEGITYDKLGVGERTVQIAIGASFKAASGMDCPSAIHLTQSEVDLQLPKPITLAPGVSRPIPLIPGFEPLTPTILPVQLFRIGQLAVTGIPAEFTTMSGRRLKNELLSELKGTGVLYVALNTYANGYSGYVATPEEYQVQHYEGASTLFGPQTLNVYIAAFKSLATALKNNDSIPGTVSPPDLSRKLKKIPRTTIRNESTKKVTLYFYNSTDKLFWAAYSHKVVPPGVDLYLNLDRPNATDLGLGRTEARVDLNRSRKTLKVAVGQLIRIDKNGKLIVTKYTPPPR